ncbi:MAG: hypothetical protein KJ718_05295 [Nanoarchaeota archaeon]|nr:hypothetical protein [Nanoarchaeota archaeon]MBU1051939.1 hypothetical protein [Nanoarchaeota archaeon]MBU1988174.1 hypothetical protein [Nanoarchaeota archaeon]
MIPEGLLEKRLREGKVHIHRNPNVNVHVQKVFYFGSLNVNEMIRDFYEGLARAIFSGSLRNRQTEEDYDIEPDITSPERKRYIEVKAAGHTRRIMLKDDQIEKYARLQISKDPIPNPRIYFTFFRYGTRGIQKQLSGKSEEEALAYFAQHTRVMVGFPLSIIHKIHKEGFGSNPLATRTSGDLGMSCTNFTTLAFDFFFSQPEQTIRRFSLYPGNYEIKRRKLGALTINKIPIKPFPFVLIKDTDGYHRKWISQLREELLRDIPF